ncbi:RolB family protein [Bradyrhizobium sp. CCGUVB23]|uniref:RolB family protein n=1 Tax=Bradyrhizobium sp. CCGUVB23 TaxID=2949630 RepID=UPI0020B3436A|nr:RolB family protein [Bradyrhizobium sp. CCGUVB23]MCP3468625.1 RolB family protein [Bradyrhizobium sp. CCGUVB23]
MANNYPAYERPQFASVDLSNVKDLGSLSGGLDQAFQQYREFTTQLLGRQQEWVVAAREIEELKHLAPRNFEEFETEPCMNRSPLVGPMECIKGKTLYVYLTDEAARACAQNKNLQIPVRYGGDDQIVMAMDTQPGRASASFIRKKYHKRGCDLVTQGDVKHFVAICSTDFFDEEGGGIWTRSINSDKFDIVAYGPAHFSK